MDLMGGTEKDGYNLSPFTFERAGKAILGSWVASRYNLPRRVALGECWNAGTPETKAARLCSNTASFVLRLPGVLFVADCLYLNHFFPSLASLKLLWSQ